MIQSFDLLDLTIALTPPPENSPADAIASMTLRCEALGLNHAAGILTDPLAPRERADLRWYLEEYPLWPYAEFAQRGKRIEALLPEIGKRLYQAAFGASMPLVQPWRLQPAKQRQISILSDIPQALSLPWELLHDEQGFLALRTRQPIAILRHLQQSELAELVTSFVPPLRVLVVTARPSGTGFLDPRSLARELLDAVQPQVEAGAVEVEFLRPPTLATLRQRLAKTKRPVHLLHFDGHGVFGGTIDQHDTLRKLGGGQGMLAFEDAEGKLDLVKAEELSQLLQDSGVKLAVLDACQSAMSADDDAFSSVAARLIQGGVDATVAMSASVLVVTSTRFFAAFYRELAVGTPVPIAQERARQDLYDDPRRHLFRRRADEEGQPVELRDWWLPHYYQQRPVSLQPAKPTRKRKKAPGTTLPRLNEHVPIAPRYGFRGRSYELLQIERALLQKKLVVIHGFGGMGKTALVCEAAEWFTRTYLYDGACFVSFEQGGDATTVLSTLGSYLNVYDGNYHPGEVKAALARLQPVLQSRRILVIADNLEIILPKGEASLESAERIQLWEVMLDLAKMGAGIVLTSRDTAFDDRRLAPGSQTIHFSLQGLQPDDAYALASQVLTDLGIDRARAPYGELRNLLAQLDHHPLAIQLVLPALRERSLASICGEFATLLPTFVDDTATGRNRSLLASLDYSLRRLPEEQRALLSRLALFEGGTNENDLLAITQIPEAAWASLRPTLEQAALLVAEQVHEEINVPFLHFHPVLLPSLRQEAGVGGAEEETALRQRYTQQYNALANYLERESFQHPESVYALVRRELPNLRKALELLLQAGEIETASSMAYYLTGFLSTLGLTRERDQLRRRVKAALAAAPALTGGALTLAEYLHELGRAQDERERGNVRAAFARLTDLLERIQALPKDADAGPGSYSHCHTLQELGYCLRDAGQFEAAEGRFREALALLEVLLKEQPEQREIRIQHAALLNNMGTVLLRQGQYTQAQACYEQALGEQRAINDAYNEAVTLENLGALALVQGDYAQARSRYLQALQQSQAMGDPRQQALAWHQLGIVAEEQGAWKEAERRYRESLTLEERVGDTARAAATCNQLAIVAKNSGRPTEAESWYKGALERIERVESGGIDHATYLNNLANLLVNEVRTGRADRSRLAEARHFVEQAQRIEEQPGVSAEVWAIYSLLARIAEMEGQPEVARDYHRHEREAYAAFAGNRYRIDQRHAPLIRDIVAATRGDAQARAKVTAALPAFEENGCHISEGVQRIWQGEREWQVLAEGLDGPDSLLLLRVLETLAAPEAPSLEERPTVEDLLAALPPSILAAIEQEDQVACQQALMALAPEEQQRVVAALQVLQRQIKRD